MFLQEARRKYDRLMDRRIDRLVRAKTKGFPQFFVDNELKLIRQSFLGWYVKRIWSRIMLAITPQRYTEWKANRARKAVEAKFGKDEAHRIEKAIEKVIVSLIWDEEPEVCGTEEKGGPTCH